jgi:hypothetical protein
MSLQVGFILRNVREMLGATCDPQLRLVSKSCNAAMATFPRELMRLEDFLSSLALFLWAMQALEMPWSREELCEVVAGGGHLEVLQWMRGQTPPCPWGAGSCAAAALGGHLEVLQWMRGLTSPCWWGERTSAEAARGGHIELLQWMQDQTPALPWYLGTLAAAAECGQLETV